MLACMNLGSRILATRKARGLTQDQVARACRVTLQMIWRYEHGKAVPSSDKLNRLAGALGVSVDFLLNGPDEPATGDAA